MAKPIPKQTLMAIERVVANHPEGIAFSEIQKQLGEDITRSTLQFLLRHLVDQGRIAMEGERRWTKYIPFANARQKIEALKGKAAGRMPVSRQGRIIREKVREPVAFRKPSGYKRAFLDRYKPNDSTYLSKKVVDHLRKIGTSPLEGRAAGTLARMVLTNLLVDLSWASSRLEGNTYSLLDTRRLIEFGVMAEGKDKYESRMILNHKRAVEFLVEYADQINFDRTTVFTLHALLAETLLRDSASEGRLRHMPVSIGKSTFIPLEIPQVIDECFNQILASASAITDPFEQAFFVMVHLPYLQPFEDVNKRTSRLAANIPLIKNNLVPLSFVGISEKNYTDSMLGVYELNKIDLLRDLFVWAYECSADRLALVKEKVGDPDFFREKHRSALRQLFQGIVSKSLDRKQAFAYIAEWASYNIDADEREQFREVAEQDIMVLHEGKRVRYKIQPAEFLTWQEVWNE